MFLNNLRQNYDFKVHLRVIFGRNLHFLGALCIFLGTILCEVVMTFGSVEAKVYITDGKPYINVMNDIICLPAKSLINTVRIQTLLYKITTVDLLCFL